MTWTLLSKELRQHGLVLALIAVATMLGYAMILGTSFARGQSGSAFEGLRLFIILIGIVTSLVLCHRLVVVEYQAKTQLFLEALPLERWRMVAVKYGLGLAIMVLLVASAFGIACLIAWRRETLGVRYLGIIASRAFSVVWLVYTLAFLMGLLGRYRLALYIASFILVIILDEQTDLRFNQFGPFALLDGRFPYEGEVFPWKALRDTWALSSVLLVLVFGLSLTREGSVAALLAEKMSHREKVFIAALLVGLTSAAAMLAEKTKKAPFDLYGAVAEQRPGVMVKIASGSNAANASSRRLAAHVASELAAAREYLGLSRLPPVFITRRRDLDANRFERGELERNEGVHVQADFGAKDWSDDRFVAWLLREVLSAASNDRVKLESKAWVLDGFALYWTQRDHADAPLSRDRTLALRALYGADAAFSTVDLNRWLSFRERVGEDIAAAVAWSGVKTLARKQGAERCRQFFRAGLNAPTAKDVRASLHERAWPLDRLLREQAGVALDAFFSQWQQELAGARRELSEELAQLPRIRGEVSFIPLSTESRKVRYRISIEARSAPPARYSFLYHQLPALDEEVLPTSIQREQNRVAQPEGELPEAYSRGGRLYSTFEVEVPALGCAVISGWTRQEIK
jgi:hypothetical protein